jgi:hypothetical protein
MKMVVVAICFALFTNDDQTWGSGEIPVKYHLTSEEWFDVKLYQDNSFDLQNRDKNALVKSYSGMYALTAEELVLTVDKVPHLRGFGYNLFNLAMNKETRIDWLINLYEENVSIYPLHETVVINGKDTVHYTRETAQSTQTIGYSGTGISSVCFPDLGDMVIHMDAAHYHYITISLSAHRSVSYRNVALKYPNDLEVDGVKRKVVIKGLKSDLN